MADIVDAKTRSRMMSAIRSKDTQPEMMLRKSLHRLGFRYRLHVTGLPGKPDLVFPSRNAMIFVHGCFWHLHNCHLFKWPSTRTEFWKDKIQGNRKRDQKTEERLREAGWRILTVWECALKGRTKRDLEEVVELAANWVQFGEYDTEIQGINDGESCRSNRLDG